MHSTGALTFAPTPQHRLPHACRVNGRRDHALESRRAQTALRRLGLAMLAMFALLAATGAARAGYVSIDEGRLDTIFRQPLDKWGWTPIDVQVLPTVSYVDTALTSIDDDSELWRLFSLTPRSSPVIDVFFVDAVNSCGGPAPNIIGCGLEPGNALAVSSYWSSTSYGPALLAHELGHNLGLDHVAQSSPNLMNPMLTGNTDLEQWQVNALYSSPFVDWNTRPGQPFFTILPVAVIVGDPSAGATGGRAALGAANGVPEPQPLALIAVAFGVLSIFASRDLRRR
jgi:hypothetical protein